YVFTRGGFVELSKKLSLPLSSTLDRYEGLVLSVGGNGRSYVLILEAGPLADPSQSKLYFARISTKVGFCRKLVEVNAEMKQDLRSFKLILEYIKALPLYDHQHHMGLLIMERRELVSKYEQVKTLAESSELMHKHDSAMTKYALTEARQREESLKKTVGVKEACIASLEKVLHEMRLNVLKPRLQLR
ncbi:hypothetical protein S83_012247, partial [Arachis hypogaea]